MYQRVSDYEKVAFVGGIFTGILITTTVVAALVIISHFASVIDGVAK